MVCRNTLNSYLAVAGPPVQLEDRAKVIATSWAAVSGNWCSSKDAMAVARLSMPMTSILTVFHETWTRRTGLGLAWPGLREAEREFLDAQVVPSQPHR